MELTKENINKLFMISLVVVVIITFNLFSFFQEKANREADNYPCRMPAGYSCEALQKAYKFCPYTIMSYNVINCSFDNNKNGEIYTQEKQKN